MTSSLFTSYRCTHEFVPRAGLRVQVAEAEEDRRILVGVGELLENAYRLIDTSLLLAPLGQGNRQPASHQPSLSAFLAGRSAADAVPVISSSGNSTSEDTTSSKCGIASSGFSVEASNSGKEIVGQYPTASVLLACASNRMRALSFPPFLVSLRVL